MIISALDSQQADVQFNTKQLCPVDYISIKQKKAKRSLVELGIQEDNKLSMIFPTIKKKQKQVEVQGWNDENMNKQKKQAKYDFNQIMNMHEQIMTKPFAEKQNNIPYLKNLLMKLEAPVRSLSHKQKPEYRTLQPPQRNSYKSSKVQMTQNKQQQSRRIKEIDLFQNLQPSARSCRLYRSEQMKPRSCSQNSQRFLQRVKQSQLVKLILLKKKQVSVKRKKVHPAKILNFKARVPQPQSRSKPKRKFTLNDLLA